MLPMVNSHIEPALRSWSYHEFQSRVTRDYNSGSEGICYLYTTYDIGHDSTPPDVNLSASRLLY